ncbi:MAG: hypothetical protein JW763_09975 [candidate division Zixibacteria bacterium]|nr:hypothetical protein [candidate division Zixibacteria bacterium]
MKDSLIWLETFRRLIDELKQCWAGKCPPDCSEQITRTDPVVNSFVYGYPTFSGKREGHKVSVTIDYFHHSVTSLMSRDDHVEMLCLSIQKERNGFISLRHKTWFDERIEEITPKWQIPCGDSLLDRTYLIQARTDRDKTVVQFPRFHSLAKTIIPFASLALRDTGAHCSIPLENQSHLTVASVDFAWARLIDIIQLADRT